MPVPLYQAVGPAGKSGSKLRRASEISLTTPGLDLATRLRVFQRALRGRVERRDALIDIVRGVNATLEPQKIAEVIVDRAATWVPAPCWAVVSADLSGQLSVLADRGLTPDMGPAVYAIATWVMRNSQEFVTPDLTHDTRVSDPAVGAPGDLNGDGIVDQHELNIVLSNYWPNSPWLYMTNVMKLESGLFQFSLTNQSAWDFSVQVSTNLADWSPLGPAYPVYQFVDPLTNGPQRYYRLRWP